MQINVGKCTDRARIRTCIRRCLVCVYASSVCGECPTQGIPILRYYNTTDPRYKFLGTELRCSSRLCSSSLKATTPAAVLLPTFSQPIFALKPRVRTMYLYPPCGRRWGWLASGDVDEVLFIREMKFRHDQPLILGQILTLSVP